VTEIITDLAAQHVRELVEGSAIDPAVIQERGYVTVARPNAALRDPYGRDTRDQLRAMGFPSWATREDYFYPGLLIPQYTPAGIRYAGQFKPSRPVPGRDGKPQRYASAKGPARLDVHPRWSADRGGMQLPAIQDPSERLWITEGVKKADALTSRGCVTVALAGVYNWRNTHATLGDWEDVRLRGREIVLCFDADAVTKPAVAQAMARLGKWLRHKGAAKVWYLTVPPAVGGSATKGVDDYFAAGGTLKSLEQALSTTPPQVTETEDRFTDARLAETLANEALEGRYIWAESLDWLQFKGNVWCGVKEPSVLETVRQWSLQRHAEAVAKLRLDDRGAAAEVDGWRAVLSKARASAVLSYSRGILSHHPDELDADADHINTPSGYLSLDTGKARPLGEAEYPTRITGARFDPEATSDVWDAFLARVLPDADVRGFVQRLIGYGLLGEVREHIMPIFTGTGRNGKGTLRDAVLAAFGTYALEVDPELLMMSNNPRHATFLMELKGRRIVFCSETEQHRRFAQSTMKRLVGGDPIQANRMREDPITFLPTHLLIMCTNHLPKITGDDPASWERIRVVPFDVFIPPEERDPRLPARLCEPDVQAAVLAWAYRGYRQYVEVGLAAPPAVLVRTERYRAESDGLGRFLAERVVESPAGRITAGALHEAYSAWFRNEGDREEVPLSKIEFGRAMVAKGYTPRKSDGIMVYRGMALTTDDQD
jgi:putative DNA primase/helicase